MLAVVVATRPLDRAYAWRFLEGDCQGHGRWIHDRIAANPLPIDVAFVGTSRTFRAIDDAAIETYLRREHDLPLHVANLGYCRPGRDLHRVIVDLLLAHKDVGVLVLEVDNRENPHSHPIQGYVAEGDALLPPPALWHKNVPGDLLHAFHVRFEAARQQLLLGEKGLRPLDPAPHAFVPVGNESPDAAFMAAEARMRVRRAGRGLEASPRQLAFPRRQLEAIAARAREGGAALGLLYLQSYGEPWADMREEALYRELGEVWLPPREVLEDPDLWRDSAHLDDEGSRRLVPFLAERVAEAWRTGRAAK